MNKEPICVCDEKTLVALLKEWQTRLFLDDWTIKIQFAENEEDLVDSEGKYLVGNNEFEYTNKCSKITIARLTEEEAYKKCITKLCVEHTIVHELLHLKMNLLDPPESMEGVYYEMQDHSLLEQLAKSLIMAKYNIPFEWYKTF